MPKGALRSWVGRLQSREFRVVGPKILHEHYVFGDIEDPADLVIEYTQSELPPKKFLLPPREVLFNFNTKTMEMQAQVDTQPTVILGVHTCDMHAIQLLDKVNNTGYTDQHYKARRDQIYLVSLECQKPCTPNAFCKSTGTLTVPDQFDLHLTDMGDVYAIEVGSEKGESLLDGFNSVWEGNDADHTRLNDVMAAKWSAFEYRLEFDITELPELLGASQKSQLWDELGERCLACGMCTKVCPTCYCFDVTDEIALNLEDGQRVRMWDSCQIEKFAIVAGGHNFRSERAKRQRHRFMRKGKYQFEAFGEMGCVGCGRCADACLVHITPVDTYNELYRRRQKALLAEARAMQTNVVKEGAR
jgi:ferredoxin